MLAAAVGAVYAVAAAYVADRITKRQPLVLQGTADSIASLWEAVSFESRGDGLSLRGWWFPAEPASRALIVIHGHGQNRFDKNWGADKIASAFLGQGYSVLLFDLRGHGESAPSRQSYGVRERNDVLGALDYVCARGFAPGQVAMIGISYGAATMLLASPEMPEVGALVADSGYAEIWPVIEAEIRRRNRLVAWLRIWRGIRLASRLLYRINLLSARPVAAVTRVAGRPILFIHGEIDAYVPPSNSHLMLAAHGNRQSELWLVPGADHAQTYLLAPDEFIRRVSAFFNAQMSGPLLSASVSTPGPSRDAANVES